MPPRILIVYNRPLLRTDDAESISECGVAHSVAAVRQIMRRAGWEVACLGLRRAGGPRRRKNMRREVRPRVIFNLFEGWPDDPASEARLARRLQRWQIPLTGCSAQALRVAGQKQRAKRALAAAGLPTPAWQVVRVNQPIDCTLRWPVIVKPAHYHGSVGIDQASVATCPRELARRVEFLRTGFRGPLLVEEFMPGREFTVGLIEHGGLLALPPMEFEFAMDRAAAWPIVSYDAKWRPETLAYQQTPARHNAPLSAVLRQELQQLARAAFVALGCRDYARVDFRLDALGQPTILEVNPNPDLGPSACLAGALTTVGINYDAWIVSLAEAALARGETAAEHAATKRAVP